MNGLGVQTKSLADTGANCYLVINKPFAKRLSKALQSPLRKLPYSVPIRGFQQNIQSHVSEYIRLHLTVEGRRIYNCPFVLLDLGAQDVIIGKKLFSRFRILLDSEKSRLVWPKEYPPTPSWSKEITLPYHSRETSIRHPAYQSDANRRDNAIHHEDRRRAGGRSMKVKVINPDYEEITVAPPSPPRNQEVPPPPRAKPIPSFTPVRICEIGANAFHHEMMRSDSEFFQTSIYEIDQIIRDKMLKEDEETLDLIKRKLPGIHRDYADVFSKSESDQIPPHRIYDHKIQLEAPLPNAFSPLYRQSTEELKATKQYLLENLEKGFIVNSSSPFASPILFVKKADGKLRFCIDYRKLNGLTRNDPYPIPRIDELLGRVSKAKMFTKLDIRQAFHRIRMHPDSEEYTTFRTRYGSYKCKVLPFGLSNGPATYQRYMNDVLMQYLDDFCTAYLDDILIYSENPADHVGHVHKVLQRLREAGLQADIKKCEFNVTRTKYLGYILTTSGVEADPDKIEPLRNWTRPTTVTGVKSFLGFSGFYRQFVRNFGKIAKPLITITRPSEPFRWTEECEAAFEELRRQLLALQALHHFQPELPTKLETDSSDGVVAGVLSQKHPDERWYPVSFYSHVLSGHEINWEIHDKELFAIVKAFAKWRPELASARDRIAVYSDHRSLEYFMTTKVLTAKQVRWMELLSGFNFRITYTAGKNNLKADILSRREQDLATQQQVKRDSRARVLLGPSRLDPRISTELAEIYVTTISMIDAPRAHMPFDLIEALCADNRKSFTEIRAKHLLPDGFTLKDHLLLYKGRLCVNRHTDLCTKLIREAHDQVSTAHPSGRKTYQLLAPKYHWAGMEADCLRYVRNCAACRLSHTNVTKQQGFLHPLPVPEYPMQHLTMDFKEFPKDKHGYDSILVFMDRLGKSSVTIPCHKTTDARQMAQLFIEWIYRFGHTPESIVSDRGPQFVSAFWQEFCRIIGVKVKLSTAYHKQTDGQTEIMNRYIDQRLRPFVSYYQDNWSELIPIMDHVQMTLPHASIGMTPYRLKYGTDPRTSWDWNTPKSANPRETLNRSEAKAVADRMHNAWVRAKENMTKAQGEMSKHANRRRRAIDWDVGDRVYLSAKNLKSSRPSRKLGQQWVGPYTVLERVGHAFRLELPPGSQIHDVFSPDVLIKAPNNPLPGQEQPEPSGEVVDGVEEWEVEKILAVRLRRKQLQYQVSWVGFDPDPEWYPAANFQNSPHKLREFHAEYPNLPGPPRDLPGWITAWETGEQDYSHEENSKAKGKTESLLSTILN